MFGTLKPVRSQPVLAIMQELSTALLSGGGFLHDAASARYCYCVVMYSVVFN